MYDMPSFILLGSAAQWLGHPTEDPGTEVLSRPLIFSLSYARDMLITSFHISYNYNYYNHNYYYVQYQ